VTTGGGAGAATGSTRVPDSGAGRRRGGDGAGSGARDGGTVSLAAAAAGTFN
jgi:hypothetical protein